MTDIKTLARAIRKSIGRKKVGQFVFLCIGTDRSTGDSFGPLVGKHLSTLGYPVIGTIDEPTHAVNLSERLREVPEGSAVIAIDACLGKQSSVGFIKAEKGPLKPGAGVGKDLPEVGNISIKGVVNVGGFMEYFVLQNTRLSLVMKMVEITVAAIEQVIPAPVAAELAATKQRKKPPLQRRPCKNKFHDHHITESEDRECLRLSDSLSSN